MKIVEAIEYKGQLFRNRKELECYLGRAQYNRKLQIVVKLYHSQSDCSHGMDYYEDQCRFLMDWLPTIKEEFDKIDKEAMEVIENECS